MAQHFPDVKRFLGLLIDFREQMAEDFTTNERYLISVGYKNYIGDVQVSARVATLLSQTPRYRQRYPLPLQRFKRKQQERLRTEALEIAALMKGKAYKIAHDQESQAFF